MLSLPTRLLGASGVSVPEVGLGCNRIGKEIQSDADWIRLLHRAADLGVKLFDTAPVYSAERSEELIGQAFGNREDVLIATKVSPVKEGDGPAFPKEVVIAGAEQSLRRLRRERIDVFQTHGAGRLEDLSDPEWAEAMEFLQTQGKIRLRAAAVNDAGGAIHVMEQEWVDVLQITYNLLDTSHADPILPEAESRGIGLLARMPYQRGILTGKFSPGQTDVGDHRARFQKERLVDDIKAAERFRALGERRPGGMTALAMQFVLAETRLSCVIPGARSINQLEGNLTAALAPPLTAEERMELQRIRSDLTGE
jgi:aryl-alcohol dehydrogenase-like predicted oxidoreductase